MTFARVFVFAVTALACGFVAAQPDQPTSPGSAVVNKCTGADGSVTFSDKPCADKEKLQKVDTSAALRTGSGGHNDAIASSVTDTDCRRSAAQSASGTTDADIDQSNRHIAEYQQRQNRLASQTAYDGSGNLVDDPEARKGIAELDALIAKERDFQQKARANVASKQEAAMKACDQAAAKNAQAQQDKR